MPIFFSSEFLYFLHMLDQKHTDIVFENISNVSNVNTCATSHAFYATLNNLVMSIRVIICFGNICFNVGMGLD